jgi:hypothetical protein
MTTPRWGRVASLGLGQIGRARRLQEAFKDAVPFVERLEKLIALVD